MNKEALELIAETFDRQNKAIIELYKMVHELQKQLAELKDEVR